MIKPTCRSVRVALYLATTAWLSSLAVCGQSFSADQPELANSPRTRTLDEWIEREGSGFSDVPEESADGELPAPKQRTAPFEPATPSEPATVILTSAQVPASESTTVSSPASVSALAADTIQRLLTNARGAVAAGNIRRARLLAEAAAEMPVPIELFQKCPERILDEIAFMTSRKQDVMTTAWNQETPAETAQPTTDTEAVQTELKDPVSGVSVAADGLRLSLFKTSRLTIGPVMITLDKGDKEAIENKGVIEREDIKDELEEPARPSSERPPGPGYNRDWTAMSYAWAAPVARHQPLYFEDPELERYGNEFCCLQPVVSGTRFYLTFATMPYQMSIPNNAWFHVKYDLGHERPGNCVPYSIHTLPVDWTAGLSATGIITGITFALMTP